MAIFITRNCNFVLHSEYKDPEGRFSLVKGLIENQLYSFISYDVPNRGQAQLFNSMFRSLSSLVKGLVIYGGDFNTAFNMGLDKSCLLGGGLIHPSKRSLPIARQIYQQGLVDVWREVNLTIRDYTHYSSPHKSFARIEHIFIAMVHTLLVTKSFIRDSISSDHSLVFMIRW